MSPTSSSSGLQSDTYPRTAAERQSAEADKKLDKAIKGICRGC